MKIIIFDCESTGLPPKGANYKDDFLVFPRILSLAYKIIIDNQEYKTYEYIVNQDGRTIPHEATKINGITQAMVEASRFNIFSVLIQFMADAQNNDFCVGHNIYFDSSLIKSEVLRIIAGGKTPMDFFVHMSAILDKEKRIDTMRICHKIFGGKWPTLGEAYAKLFGETFQGHTAASDVEATTRIFKELMKRNAIKLVVPNNVSKELLGTVLTEEE